MISFKARVLEAVRYLKDRFTGDPKIALLTGTGLGESAASFDIRMSIAYEEIPYFPVSTVQGHIGRLLFGKMKRKYVLSLQGRFHLYEGYSPLDVTFPIRVMQELGIDMLILSNAAGGLNPAFRTGDIMIIADHINLTGANPLIGPNDDEWGIRFPDMTQAYGARIRGLAEAAGKKAGIDLKQGVYAGLRGPSLETPAEVRFLRAIGADAVGFSTVQEVIAAVHAGIRVLGLSTITNINDPDNPTPVSVGDILAVAKQTVPKLESVIEGVVEAI